MDEPRSGPPNDPRSPSDPSPSARSPSEAAAAPASSDAPAPDPAGGAGLLRRVLWVFVSPGALFRELRERPAWFGALALGVVLGAVGTALIPVELFEEQLRTQLIESGQELPADIGTFARMTWVFGVFGMVVIWPLLALVSAGIYALLYLFVFGYQGNFRTLFAITAHALLIAAVASVLLVPLRIAAGDPQLSLSVGTFLTFLEEGYVSRLAGLLDLFNLWAYVLVGMGAAIMDGRRALGHGIGISVGTALLVSVVIAAFIG